MSYTKIERALESVLPGAVYKVQAPIEDASGKPITRYLVWTPTGERYEYADGKPFATVHTAVVTVGTQTEDDDLPRKVTAALAEARVAMQPPEHSYDDELATYFTDIPCEVI